MLEVNFKNKCISEFNVSIKVALDDELIDKIKELSPPDEDGDSAFFALYKKDGVTHFALTLVQTSERKENGETLIITLFRINRGVRSVRKLRHQNQKIAISSCASPPLCL